MLKITCRMMPLSPEPREVGHCHPSRLIRDVEVVSGEVVGSSDEPGCQDEAHPGTQTPAPPVAPIPPQRPGVSATAYPAVDAHSTVSPREDIAGTPVVVWRRASGWVERPTGGS